MEKAREGRKERKEWKERKVEKLSGSREGRKATWEER